jgi:hypothetical protein
MSSTVIYNKGILTAKSSAGTVYGLTGKSPSAGWLKIFDLSAAPVLGTATAIIIEVPFYSNTPFDYSFPEGVTTANGIQVVATTHEYAADTDQIKTSMTCTIRYS